MSKTESKIGSEPRILPAEDSRVPIEEPDVKVIDMKLGEIFLGITGCMALTAIAFTYYSHVKAKTEERRIHALAEAVASVAGDLSMVFYDKTPFTGFSKDVPVKVTKKKTVKNKAVARS